MNLRTSICGLLVCVAIFTANSAVAGAQTPLTPAKALSYRRIADLHLSPDGLKLAFIVYSYPEDWTPQLWLMDIAAGQARNLTPPKKAERAPQFSPDGRTLAFLSNRDGKTQIYTMPVNGDVPVALTARQYGVQNFHWSPDSRAIAYLAKDDPAPGEDGGPQIADDERGLARLWIVDPAAKTARSVGGAGVKIDDFQWQDPSEILVASTDRPRVEEFTDAIYGLSAADGTLRLVGRPPQPFDSLRVSPDGRAFSVRSTDTAGPEPRDIFVGGIDRGDLHDATRALDRSVSEMKWTDPSTMWLRVADGFYNRIYRLRLGMAPQRIELPLSVDSFDVFRDGGIVFAGGDFDHLPEIYIRAADGTIRQLTHLQQDLEGVHLGTTTIFHTRSFDGTDIEAALIEPPDAPRIEKRPLVLIVHGGPASNFTAGYDWEEAWAQMLVSHGYDALLVNPRGSNGYGEDFVKANRGDWGGGDYKDLMAVLDAVIARGSVDPDRLGIGGWSYGAEMSEWAITQTNRFKAAVAGAGVFDQQAEFETESWPAGDEWYLGNPWENREAFARNSAATFIRNAHTPTLIFDGLDDTSNPVGQSKGLYRALKYFGVETEMVLYPGEGHSPRKMSYNVDMFERILDWYDSHLKKTH
jgi:dipeptidyl aminopeptidase/acylaminoacyl peptidase